MGDCSRVAALPLNQLQSLCERIPRGVKTLPLFIEGVPEGGGSIYTARDYSSKGCAIDDTAIESITIALQPYPTLCVTITQ